jgi:hypothetical protein
MWLIDRHLWNVKIENKSSLAKFISQKVPIMALKFGLIRQVDRKHRIACFVNRDLNWGFEKN